MSSNTIIITRHPALVNVLRDLVPELADAEVVAQGYP